MKKLLLALVALSAVCVMADDHKVTFVPRNVCPPLRTQEDALKDGVVTIKGDPANKQNGFLVVSAALGNYEAGKNIELEAKIKTQITKGAFWVKIRFVDENNKTLSYEGFTVSKTLDWTEMKTVIKPKDKVKANAKTIQIYCAGINLDADSFGQVKDIEWEFKD